MHMAVRECGSVANGKKRLSTKKTAESLDFGGTPGEIRTPDPLIRSQILYPAELRALI